MEMKHIWGIFAAIVVVISLIWVGNSVNKINETERGVKMRAGKVVNVVTPGYEVVLYPIYSIDKLSVQQDTNVFPNINAYTKDSQQVKMNVSVTYQLKRDDESIIEFYRNFRTMDNFLSKILRRNITDSMQVVLGQFSARETITDRNRFNTTYLNALTEALEHQPVEILSVQVEDIEYDREYMARINRQVEAEVVKETEKTQADTLRITAQGKADAMLAQGKAEADRIALIAKAEADSVELMKKALKGEDAETIVKLRWIEKWDGKQPTMQMGGGNGVVPFIDVTKVAK